MTLKHQNQVKSSADGATALDASKICVRLIRVHGVYTLVDS